MPAASGSSRNGAGYRPWRRSVNVNDGTARTPQFRPILHAGQRSADTPAACALAIRPPDGLPILRAGGTGTVCAIAVDGLTPGTSYAYTPLADGAALSGEAVFRTDDATRPFSFLAVGDSGCGCSGAL